MSDKKSDLPLCGIRVLEMGHAVMGPSCGVILADMGAEVIKVERAPDGDPTRRLPGFGVGLYPYFNRNKKSLVLNLKSEAGRDVLRKLLGEVDVFLENFGPGAVERLGFSYEECAKINPRLIYCALKGFMPGPYENRPSLDNLVQMMGGLAYMTGPTGTPLRAGASIIDIMGGTYGALGIITALYERERTGKGQKVLATLYEATAFLVGQHMACSAITGEKSIPMCEGTNPWAVYDLFTTGDGDQIFVGMTSDFHWQRFCKTFGLDDLAADENLATNHKRVENRESLIPRIEALIASLPAEELIKKFEEAKIPFAPVVRPDQLFDDPQLNQGGCLVETELPSGEKTKLPKLPLRMDDYDFGLRSDPPSIGEGSRELMLSLGYSEAEVEEMLKDGIMAIKDA